MYSSVARHARLSLVLLAMVGAACSSDSGTGGGGGDNNSCSFTLSGAVTATVACTTTTAAAAYISSSNQTTVAFATATTGGTSAVAAVEFTGQPSTSTHSSSDTDAVGGVSVTSGGQVYLASAPPSPFGSYSLHITSVSQIGTSGTGTAYTVHGTLTGTLLLNGTPGAATVTVNATF